MVREQRKSPEGFWLRTYGFFEDCMAALMEAITVKRKMYFEFENTPYYCMEAEVSRPRRAAARR